MNRFQEEYHLQIAVVKHLNMAFPGLLWTHCPNRPANAKDGFMKKQMGVRPGVADFLFWYNNAYGAIELKAAAGRWGNDQNRFASAFVAQGGKFALCKTVREVHDTLIGWGIKTACTTVTEPDLRSMKQKQKDVFDMYAPLSKPDGKRGD